MKKKICLIALLLILLSIIICGCSEASDRDLNTTNNNPHTTNDKPQLISIADKEVTDTIIDISVDKTKDTLELFNMVCVTDGAVWKVYDKDDNLKANRVINLKDGYNTFYIEVSCPDGSYPTTYTLNVLKSYYITVRYVWWEGLAEHLLKEVTIEQMELFVADYIPEIYGYDFISWHTYSFDDEFTQGRSSQDFKLVAKVVPKPVRIHLIVDGEEWQTINTEYGKWVDLPIPEKEHYMFYNSYWYEDENYIGLVSFNEYRCYKWGDVYVYGKFEPRPYSITYDYGEITYHFKDVQSVKYGEEFVIKEPRWTHRKIDGISYVLQGFLYNGQPFTDGIYYYDGSITVTAVWLPVEE